ncbi:MAG: sigma-70 family RNA polymerase sigma factor [Prevotella sp.]|nr:sigma-70 family RNA polymerase sigma factor [Bacteroides sp.]MCM1365924.1 sigma-70 family RNA polymerase sigma factor [Prevotella sp.]MCM1436655.1 sigma-70 family RNA polymerase sigma factor [Prevotella sp.]
MPLKKASDEQSLVKELQTPSKAKKAFDELMRTYGEGMYWQIRKLVNNHDDALDLLQNAFLKAWNNIGNFRGDAKLSTWLYKIAINESINFLNKERQRRNTTSEDENDAYRLENIEADPYFDGNEAQVALQRAIASLPQKQRLVFNMRYFDDMHYDEISEILGTSVGALKASYHHAVKKIETALKDICG